ncbi:hypothetical protein AZE42_11593 [Rhizopogon vesiculosus]|uniref:Uncharacterized protein n=1 Tax=Rhizopogon vesiculosus TaxID=180088 RepID=A0A1J8QYF8_9AGAM|nr:hypothetical protein AZE42_11593 [Rhizopogon vesiculosus]
MSRSQQKILSQLASSPNDVASGLAQCVEALRLISSLPRSSPVMVEYSGAKGSTTKAFGREHLSRVQFRIMVGILKASLQLPDGARIATATFYREDGTVDPTKVLIDEDSWKELVPYVHTLHIEDENRGGVISFFKSSADFPNSESEWQREQFRPRQKYSDDNNTGWRKGQLTSSEKREPLSDTPPLGISFDGPGRCINR